MRRVIWGIGIEYDKDNILIPPHRVELFKRVALDEALDMFGGCNVTYGLGGWINTVGASVVENSMQVEVFTIAPNETIREYSNFLKRLFNQESILEVISHPQAVNFV